MRERIAKGLVALRMHHATNAVTTSFTTAHSSQAALTVFLPLLKVGARILPDEAVEVDVVGIDQRKLVDERSGQPLEKAQLRVGNVAGARPVEEEQQRYGKQTLLVPLHVKLLEERLCPRKVLAPGQKVVANVGRLDAQNQKQPEVLGVVFVIQGAIQPPLLDVVDVLEVRHHVRGQHQLDDAGADGLPLLLSEQPEKVLLRAYNVANERRMVVFEDASVVINQGQRVLGRTQKRVGFTCRGMKGAAAAIYLGDPRRGPMQR
ncbi:ribonuclease D [Babesia caballi]|uniref:Ribonuclease D n=1 Tax=Babesia caballi TaxID=5871 RepID=A0AAV4LSS1_BABCB|nr:ribonuclease D [Babesia caballi]